MNYTEVLHNKITGIFCDGSWCKALNSVGILRLVCLRLLVLRFKTLEQCQSLQTFRFGEENVLVELNGIQVYYNGITVVVCGIECS